MTAHVAAAALAAVALGAGASPARAQGRATIVASADGVDVSRGELEDEIVEARTSGDLHRTQLTLTVDGLDTFVRGMVERKLLAVRARSAGLDRDPEVARQIERQVTRLLAEALVGHTRAAVDVGPGAVNAFFEAQADRFRPPSRRKVRHIVVATEDEARRLRADVHDAAAFDAAARRLNIDGTATTGGDLGWVAPGSMVRTFDALVFTAPPRTVAGPVRTSRGWHLAFVEEVDPGTLPPLDLVRDRVVDAMKQDAVEAVIRDLRERIPVGVNRDQLVDLLK